MAGNKPAARDKAEEARERLLIEAAQADPGKFAALYEIHFERIYAYVARRVRARDVAEDLTAEVFQKALANLPRFNWRGAPFVTWLFRIASNVIADKYKKSGRETPVAEESMSVTTQANLEEVERQAELFRLVNELPGEQRLVIALRFAEEKSIKDIAQQMGRSEGAIKQLQFRGLQNLRKQLGEKNG
ncbi:MAG TPA: sigma-70 family RNA polymerase sigma factor [Pyrinomonadaceae bacterium]|nr:sigma-70 family RNA polymerase sigma factor [Pyrinomonadaceae bacterium]